MSYKLFYWPAILIWSLFGFLVCAFLVYPPACGWGLKIRWGDVATWFSGICVLSTVIVALYLAKTGDRRTDAAREKLASILAAMSIEDVYATIAHLQHHLMMARDPLFSKQTDLILLAFSKVTCPALERCAENLPTFDVEIAVDIGRAFAKMKAVAILAENNINFIQKWTLDERNQVMANVAETAEIAIAYLYSVFQELIRIGNQPPTYDPRRDGIDTFKKRKEKNKEEKVL